MNQTSQLEYTCTNEDLRGVVLGLDLSPQDSVLAVAGSGDQAFAFLEFVKHVRAVDIVPEQIDFMRGRLQSLRARDYERFLRVDVEGVCDGNLAGTHSPEFAEFNRIRRRKYFVEDDSQRLSRIQQNLGNLTIVDPVDILELAQQENGFNKIYLSNVLTYGIEDRPAITEILRNMASRLPVGGLIYVASHDGLTSKSISMQHKKDDNESTYQLENSLFNQIANTGIRTMYKVDRYDELYQDPDLRDESFLPPELRVDRELSLEVRKHERGIWKPAVYIKVEPKTP
jgi:hypothetical protein